MVPKHPFSFIIILHTWASPDSVTRFTYLIVWLNRWMHVSRDRAPSLSESSFWFTVKYNKLAYNVNCKTCMCLAFTPLRTLFLVVSVFVTPTNYLPEVISNAHNSDCPVSSWLCSLRFISFSNNEESNRSELSFHLSASE